MTPHDFLAIPPALTAIAFGACAFFLKRLINRIDLLQDSVMELHARMAVVEARLGTHVPIKHDNHTNKI